MDWLNRKFDATVRVLSIRKGEVDVLDPTSATDLTQGSTIAIVNMVTVNTQSAPKAQHKPWTNGRIWDSFGVLRSDWAAFVSQRQQEIDNKTIYINEWADREATRIITYLDTLPQTEDAPVQHESVEDVLGAAALNPNLSNETREMLVKFYAEFAGKARNLRNKVSALKEEIQKGLDIGTLDTDPKGLDELAKIIRKEGRKIRRVEVMKLGPTGTDQLRSDSAREVCIRDHKIIDGGGNGDQASNHQNPAPPTPLTDQIATKTLESSGGITASRHKEKLPGDKARDDNQTVDSVLENQIPVTIRSAPEDGEHLLRVLAEVERHWRELANFEAKVRARKFSLESLEKVQGNRRTRFDESESVLGQRKSDASQIESVEDLGRVKFGSTSQVTSKPVPKVCATESSGKAAEKQQHSNKEEKLQLALELKEWRPWYLVSLTPKAKFYIKVNLARRNSSLNAAQPPSPAAPIAVANSEHSTDDKHQQIPDQMAGIHGGSAHSFASALTAAPLLNAFQVAQQPKTEGYWVNMDAERELTFTLVPVSRLIRSVDPDYASGFHPQWKSTLDALQLNSMSKMEVFVGRLVEQPACGLEGETGRRTQIFRATIIDRRLLVGRSLGYSPGFLVTAGNLADEKVRIIQQGNPIFAALRSSIQDRQDEKDQDMNQSVVPPQRESPTWDGRAAEEFPLIELDVDYGRLHHITSNFERATREMFRQQIPDATWQLGQGILSPASDSSPAEYACFARMRNSAPSPHCNPSLAISDALSTTLTSKSERLFTIGPMAHVDTIARLSMELVPNTQLPDIPPYTEHQYQHYLGRLLGIRGPWRVPPQIEWAGMAYCDPTFELHLSKFPSHLQLLIEPLNRYQVYTLLADKSRHFFLENVQPEEGARAFAQVPIDEVLEKLPRSVVFTERDQTPKLDAVWRTEQWEINAKVIQYNFSARPNETARIPGFQPYLTRVDKQNDLAISIRRPIFLETNRRNIHSGISASTASEAPAESLRQDVYNTVSETVASIVEPVTENETVEMEQIIGQGNEGEQQGHVLTKENLSQRRQRANSLPLPIQRLSIQEAPSTFGKASDLLNPSEALSPVPEPVIQRDSEKEEGEISELDDMGQLQTLPHVHIGSSEEASDGLSRTASERQREFDNPYDVSSDEDHRFNTTRLAIPPRYGKNAAAPHKRRPKTAAKPHEAGQIPFPAPPRGPSDLPPLQTALPIIQVHSVFVNDKPVNSTRKKKRLPKLKRRAEEVDGMDQAQGSSNSGNLVLGAVAGPSNQVQTSMRAMGGIIGGALDFWGQGKTLRRSFPSQVQSADESMDHRQIELPGVGSKLEDVKVFQRRHRTLEIVLDTEEGERRDETRRERRVETNH
ncbi:hypothetical protein C8J56DRAFT_904240 [Mycena floridula]|nr:hypothetical protein C8J56DRAFT_904240 [Mycena floridula]